MTMALFLLLNRFLLIQTYYATVKAKEDPTCSHFEL